MARFIMRTIAASTQQHELQPLVTHEHKNHQELVHIPITLVVAGDATQIRVNGQTYALELGKTLTLTVVEER